MMLVFATGCQLGYLLHVSYNHLAMLNSKVPISRALANKDLSADQIKKINLTQEVRKFSFEQLGLSKSKNYTEYIDLKRPYVTYAVMAAYKWKLEPYLWKFPFIGKAPYKGYYNEKMAQQEASEMKSKDFDVYVRGVAAFSTLGKLTDPLLSSMLNYSEHDLVNTIIHELVHTTLFIKDNIDFNERLAVFVAGKGTELFYFEKEGPKSTTLQLIKNENEDDKLFSVFITRELNDLKQWYINYAPAPNLTADTKEGIRQARIELIRSNFTEKLSHKLKTTSYQGFTKGPINNARLSNFNTYLKDLDLFEKVYQKNGYNIHTFLQKCAVLNSVDDPELELKKWATSP
ncbi:MAG: aminopeptidase [Bdellovibrionaceae bacterium]|nr:aminopeptidase [Bdellovibrio sp.]